jgi:hypothetical protein
MRPGWGGGQRSMQPALVFSKGQHLQLTAVAAARTAATVGLFVQDWLFVQWSPNGLQRLSAAVAVAFVAVVWSAIAHVWARWLPGIYARRRLFHARSGSSGEQWRAGVMCLSVSRQLSHLRAHALSISLVHTLNSFTLSTVSH